MYPGERPLRAYLQPIDDILSDPRTREVVVNRPGEVGYENADGWHWRDVPAFSFDRLEQIAILAAYQTHRDADRENPLVRSTLPDGQRIYICMPPATLPQTVALCIRRPPSTARTMEDDDFADLFSETNAPVSKSRQYDEQLAYLLRDQQFYPFFKLARKARKTIDVCGPTGTGKTDFLRRIMQETGASMRALTIESDAEFGRIGPRNTVNLFYNDQHPALSPETVVRAGLRMRPDEMWFQETQGAEAWAVMRARASGHRGGGTSWHAEQGKEIDALMLMIRQYPPVSALDKPALRELCEQFIDIIVWCDRVPDAGFKCPRIWMKGMADA